MALTAAVTAAVSCTLARRCEKQPNLPRGIVLSREDLAALVGAESSLEPRAAQPKAKPLTGEWAAPPHAFLLPDRGAPPSGWMRSGPGAMTQAWCAERSVSNPAAHTLLPRTPCDSLAPRPLVKGACLK